MIIILNVRTNNINVILEVEMDRLHDITRVMLAQDFDGFYKHLSKCIILSQIYNN